MKYKNISMNVWLIYDCELKNLLTIKEDANTDKPCVDTRLPKPLLEILPIYGNYFRKKLCESVLYQGFSDCFIATPDFQVFSRKSIKMVKAFIDGKTFQVLT